MICPPEHKHGQVSTCYIQHKCRCDECREAGNARERRRAKARAYGRDYTGLVDSSEAREHVLWLMSQGMGWKRLAEVSGVGKTAVASLIYGRKGANSDPRKGELVKRIPRTKADALLAVQPTLENLSDGALIDSRGTRRRIQALVAMGWSLSKIAVLAGIEPTNMSIVLNGTQCTAKRARIIAAIYEELWDQMPPRDEWHDKAAYSRARGMAKQKGWLPPLAWDDIDLDDSPAEGEFLTDKNGKNWTSVERSLSRIEDVETLLNAGMGSEYILQTLKVSRPSLEQTLYRYSRGDLASRLNDERKTA